MFKLTVYKYGTFKNATEEATRFLVLVDHLKASAARGGFEVTFDDPDEGELFKDNVAVAGWHIEEV